MTPRRPGVRQPYQEPIQLPQDIGHGSLTGYQRGCRCEQCFERRRSYDREYWELNRAMRRRSKT